MCVVRLFIEISTVVAFSIKVTQICNYQRIQTKKLQYRKFGITGLKSSFRVTEKYIIMLPGLPSFFLKIWLSKVKCYVPFSLKKRLKRNYRKEILNCTFLPAELERVAEVLQFDVCCKAIDQSFDCGCNRCKILRLDSLEEALYMINWLSYVTDLAHDSLWILDCYTTYHNTRLMSLYYYTWNGSSSNIIINFCVTDIEKIIHFRNSYSTCTGGQGLMAVNRLSLRV